jgi:dUTP pyrophosphatase
MVIVKKEIVNHIDTTNVVVYPYEKALTQAVLLPVPKTNITEISIEEFSNFGTSRGTGMLGSSGK